MASVFPCDEDMPGSDDVDAKDNSSSGEKGSTGDESPVEQVGRRAFSERFPVRELAQRLISHALAYQQPAQPGPLLLPARLVGAWCEAKETGSCHSRPPRSPTAPKVPGKIQEASYGSQPACSCWNSGPLVLGWCSIFASDDSNVCTHPGCTSPLPDPPLCCCIVQNRKEDELQLKLPPKVRTSKGGKCEKRDSYRGVFDSGRKHQPLAIVSAASALHQRSICFHTHTHTHTHTQDIHPIQTYTHAHARTHHPYACLQFPSHQARVCGLPARTAARA